MNQNSPKKTNPNKPNSNHLNVNLGNLPATWAVIFDVDGTMVDNVQFHQQAWIELGKRHDIPIDDSYYRTHIHARSNDRIVRTLLGDGATPQAIDKYGSEKETIYRETFRPHAKEIPGLTALLKDLAANSIPCAAASNSPKGNVDMVLEELGIAGYFDFIIDNDQVTKGKPNPEILLTCAEKLALPPSRCIVMEDSLSGFKAAQNAPMPYIVITTGADEKDFPHATNAKAFHQNFTTINTKYLKALLT